MAGRGPAPKPAHLRQRTNSKPVTQIEAPTGGDVPEIPNPDGRQWHPLTVAAWGHAWASPMASQWIETDVDALGRLALLWDALYSGSILAMSEIRLQEQRFGLSPLDRSRLQWEVSKAEEVNEKSQQRKARMAAANDRRTGTHDPRRGLMAVK